MFMQRFLTSSGNAERILIDESPLWLGIEYVPLKDKLIKALNVPYLEGLLVQRVAKGSFGDELRVKAGDIPVSIGRNKLVIGGDIIVEAGGERIYVNRKGIKRSTDYLNAVKPGEKVTITVIREGKKIVLSAKKPMPNAES